MNSIGKRVALLILLGWAALLVSIVVCGCAGAADDESIDSLGRPITNPGGICWSDDAFGGPGCQPHPQPPLECAANSSCETSPISDCAARCNYGYVCTANCATTPVWKSSHHSSCNNIKYLPMAEIDPLGRHIWAYYNPGPDLKCGTWDEVACASDGRNPGADGLCNDGSHPEWDYDNHDIIP